MNPDQFKSFWVQLKAPLQAQWEKLTDQDLLQIDGNMMTFNTLVDQRFGGEQAVVKRWANRRYAHWSGWYQDYEWDKGPFPKP